MRAELRRLQRSLGIPFVHVTHGQDEALALADLAVVMNKGKIEQAGAPKRFVREPASTEFIARFLGGPQCADDAGRSRSPCAPTASRSPAPPTPPTRLRATVTGVEYQGGHYLVALEGGGALQILSAAVPDARFAAHPAAIGDEVGLVWHRRRRSRAIPGRLKRRRFISGGNRYV